ncbi:hypothetical protein AMTR_s00026p00183720 [Amborella trichopoda]|uniref:Aminotransferase-like plant mobile domain-containing protein n=1 Tax=Amborella trichopoda TaxID=13333 RepID=W1PQS8_AMBTC|nr:hypothetical protein AMTR_s00026p00183720 [Amborella trichopoda]
MTGDRAPHILISTASRPSHRGKAPMEEDSESRSPGVNELVQGESSRPLTRATIRGLAKSSVRSSGNPEGVECDTPEFDDVDMDGGAILDEYTCRQGSPLFGGCSILLQVWVWEHINIPRPLSGRLALSFSIIHRWSYGVSETEKVFSRLYYSLDTQVTGEINWTLMRVDHVPTDFQDDGPFDLHVLCDAILSGSSTSSVWPSSVFLQDYSALDSSYGQHY